MLPSASLAQAQAQLDAANSGPLREFLAIRGWRALLLEGTEGEAFANPRRRPRLEYLAAGERRVLFGAESTALRHAAALPQADDARSTAE